MGAKYYGIYRDSEGDVIASATVNVYEPGTTTHKEVFSDDALTTPIVQPFSSGVDGSVTFFGHSGQYRVLVEKSGFGSFDQDNLVLVNLDTMGNLEVFATSAPKIFLVDESVPDDFWVAALNANQDFVINYLADGTAELRISQSGDVIVPAGGIFIVNDGLVIGGSTTTPSAALAVNTTTGAVLLPRLTTGERDALTATNGMMIYNTTTNQIEGYENGAWVDL